MCRGGHDDKEEEEEGRGRGKEEGRERKRKKKMETVWRGHRQEKIKRLAIKDGRNWSRVRQRRKRKGLEIEEGKRSKT